MVDICKIFEVQNLLQQFQWFDFIEVVVVVINRSDTSNLVSLFNKHCLVSVLDMKGTYEFSRH